MKPLAVSDWVFLHAERTPNAPAIDSPEHRLSYRLLAKRISAIGEELLAIGVRAGDRVLVTLPNQPAAVVMSLAVQHIGAVSVEVSRELGAEQFREIVEHSGARCAAFAGRDARKVAPLLRTAGMRHAFLIQEAAIPESMCASLRGLAIVRVGDDGRLLDHDESAPVARRALPAKDPSSVVQILYTSGSTGQPRGVMQTVENVATNTRAIVQYLRLTQGDRAMLILPLSYCYGRSVLQTHLFVGGSVFLDHRFMYPQVVLDAIGTERCTGFAGVPLTFELLQRQTKPDMNWLRSLRYITQAGGAMRPNTADWVRTTFAPARLFVMYGQTEATARLSYLPPERLDKNDSIGIPLADVELRVVDESGVAVPFGMPGQIVARGPSITPGYYRQPEETARILRDGWLWTGDIGYRDEEGFFFVLGREKEILKVGGHRVSPAEIEATLAQCDGILEAAVVGTKDALMGEVPAALVVLKPQAQLSGGEVRKFCAARLPAYMVPRMVVFASTLPRGSSGKLLRTEVRRMVANDEQEARSSL